jgi:hypothetical protein
LALLDNQSNQNDPKARHRRELAEPSLEPRKLSTESSVLRSLQMDVVNAKSITISMKDSKKPWYQLKDSETKWYHHLMHGRVLIMLVLMAIVGLLAIGVGIYSLFGN